MSIKIGLQNERVVIKYTDDAIEQYRADGDVEAIDGSTSSTITVRLTSNDAILIADYEYDDFLDLNGSQHGASRSIVKTKLNDLVFNGALYPRGSSILFSNQLSQPLSKGVAVSVSSYDSSLDLPMGGTASNNVSSMMPAIGLTKTSIGTSNQGEVVTNGILDKMDTSSYSSGDVLYVGEAGALTNTKPTGSSAVVQRIAVVVRSHATLGSVYVDVQDVSHLLRDNSPQLGGDLDVNGNDIVSSSNGDIVLDPHGSGSIVLKADNVKMEGSLGTSVTSIKFFEFGVLEGNYIALKAPFSVTSDLTFTLPATDGNAGQVLKTNGSAVLGWQDALSGVNETLTGITSFKDAGATRGTVALYDDNGDNFVALRSPDVLTSDTVYVLPSADGTSGQVLQTNGSGTMSWTTMPMVALANVSGRFYWQSTDDGERVYTGSSVYGPYNFYSHSTEPSTSTFRDYSGSEIAGVTSASISGSHMIQYGIKNPYSGKKVRVDYSFRIYYSGSVAPTTGTPFGFSLWSGNANATGSASNVTVLYRGESDDHAMVAVQAGGTTSHHHGSFTTSTNIEDDYLFVLAEHRSSTGLNGNTYMVANYNVFITD